jgi:hypothetical protein
MTPDITAAQAHAHCAALTAHSAALAALSGVAQIGPDHALAVQHAVNRTIRHLAQVIARLDEHGDQS